MKVPPRDAALFSAQTFAFAALNEDSAMALLGRSLPDGGGNTFFNMADTGGDKGRAWIQLDTGTLRGDQTAASPVFHADNAGVQAGADATLAGNARLGAALGYDQDWLRDGYGGTGREQVFRASVYGSASLGPIGVSAAASWAHAWDDTGRATGAGDAGASRGTNAFTGAVQVAAPLAMDRVLVTPAVGVIVTHLTGPGFGETSPVDNGAFAVIGQGAAVTFVSPFAKIGVSRSFTDVAGVTWTPDAEIGYRRDGAAAGGAFSLTAVDGTAFTGNRVGLDKDAALLGASLTAHRMGWTVFVKYRAEVARNWTDQSVAAGLRLAF